MTIFTDKVDSVADFYQRLLDAKPSHPEDRLAIFKVGDANILIHARYDPAPGWLPCENHVCFAVSDLDRSVAQLEHRGVTVEIPPREYEWGRSAYLRDPDSHLLELHQCTQ